MCPKAGLRTRSQWTTYEGQTPVLLLNEDQWDLQASETDWLRLTFVEVISQNWCDVTLDTLDFLSALECFVCKGLIRCT